MMRDLIVRWAEEWAEDLLPRHWSRNVKMLWMGALVGTVLGLAVLASYLLYSGLLALKRKVRTMERSFANGNGYSSCNGDMRQGSPIPFYLLTPAYLDARAMSTTFWDLL